MHAPTCRHLGCSFLLALNLWVLAPVHANPETIGTWMPIYAVALGLNSKGLPFQSEYFDEFTAIVDKPAALEKFGLAGVTAGDQLVIHSHENGYFTLRHIRTNHSVKVALAWVLRYGLEPDKGLADGEPPDRIEGNIVDPRVLAVYGFTTGATAKRFVIQYGNGAWKLTLNPGGECRAVPF